MISRSRLVAFASTLAVLGLLVLEGGAHKHASARQQSPGVSKLAGTWTWTWKDPASRVHKHILEVEGIGKALSAREIFDDEPPVRVSTITFDGKAVHLAVERGERKAVYDGRMTDADTIDGLVKTATGGEQAEYPWKATRQKPEPKK